MKKRIIFLFLSLLCLLAAAGLALREHAAYQSSNSVFPLGTKIAGIPVGGQEMQAAGLRLAQAYGSTPVELRYQGAPIQIMPQQAGFQLDLEPMLDAAQVNQPTFWEYLFNRRAEAGSADLTAIVDKNLLRDYLQAEILPRYGQRPTPAQPIPGGWDFAPGQPGEELDVDTAVNLIAAALHSLEQRVVDLPTQPVDALPADFGLMEPMLEALIKSHGFDGTLELYLQDLQSGEEIQLAYHNGQPVEPGIAFTAASTIKIPVMVSAFRHLEGELPADVRQSMELMIDLSDNSSTDNVMQRTMDENLAPIQVTQDLQAMGMENTFLAGFFYPGAPLLDLITTPANGRGDISTDPDLYNQTTPAEIGHILAGIENCATQGKGLLLDSFPAEITQAECQLMVEMLKKNRKGVLIEAGLPEGTPLAHKYGWVTDPLDGLMHNASDAAVVYTPGGSFVLSIYLYDTNQLMWDPAQLLVARLTTAVYNYYNQHKN